MAETFSESFIKEQFDNLEKSRSKLISKVVELAEKTGERLEVSNTRIGELHDALGSVKGKTKFDWIMMIGQIVIIVLILAVIILAMTKGYDIEAKWDYIKLNKKSP